MYKQTMWRGATLRGVLTPVPFHNVPTRLHIATPQPKLFCAISCRATHFGSWWLFGDCHPFSLFRRARDHRVAQHVLWLIVDIPPFACTEPSGPPPCPVYISPLTPPAILVAATPAAGLFETGCGSCDPPKFPQVFMTSRSEPAIF